MADLERYEVAGPLLLCRTCGAGGTRFIVKDFGHRTIDVAELHTEVFIHETDHHEAVFENNATENAGAALRSSQALSERADRVAREIRDDEYYACYADETAYRDGMVNGMGGAAGDMASLLGPQAVRHLARALEYIAATGRDYPELIQDHNRKTCDDFTCYLYGELVEIARDVDRQLGG